MTKPIIFDGETHRQMDNAEFAQWQIDVTEAEAEAAAADAKAAALASARAKLAALGLTADEIAAFLG